jgi:hypothetical protein
MNDLSEGAVHPCFDKPLKLRLSEQDYALLSAMANAYGLKVAALARMLVHKELHMMNAAKSLNTVPLDA